LLVITLVTSLSISKSYHGEIRALLVCPWNIYDLACRISFRAIWKFICFIRWKLIIFHALTGGLYLIVGHLKGFMHLLKWNNFILPLNFL